MTEIDVIKVISEVGFPIFVSIFLLWKGYTQDKAYMLVLTELKTEILEIRKELGVK